MTKTTSDIKSEYVIKAIYYSKPRILTNAQGEPVAGRYGVLYTVGLKAEITGIGFRKVTSIIYSKDIDGFEIRFDDIDKVYPRKGLITVPRLADTETYYEVIENKILN